MRRVVLRWVAAFAVLVVAGVGSVALIVAIGFGPGSFVTAYLEALGRRDAASALALPGVDAGSDSADLLRTAALPGLAGIRITGDIPHDGMHRITATWTSGGTAGESTFEVRRLGTRFGVFPIWGFAQSPIAHLSLEVRNARDVTVGSLTATTPGTGAHAYALLVPGLYTFSHETAYLAAQPQTVLADTVGQDLRTRVDVEATPRFEEAVGRKVTALLDACARQQVLFPTGCPFGEEIPNRVASTPTWSITHYPTIRLTGAGDDRTWRLASLPATAHLTVKVQSLYDGTASTFDQDVPFTISATVRFDDAGNVTISNVQ
jgi:hypothetical protein